MPTHPHPTPKRILATVVEPVFLDTDARWSADNGFVIAIDAEGKVVHNLQDDDKAYVATSSLEYDCHLYVGSVAENGVAKI